MKRIGEILVANGWIEPSILERALVKQRETGHRLCSLLVLSGSLGADEAACALGEQHGVAAVLQRHITRRDRSLASLLSPALARACVALPIGRMGSGEVIVCVRDPSAALETQLARAMKQPIRLAVAPAQQLEELVLETYGPHDANEFDVDLSTGPIMSLELEDAPEGEPASDDAMGLGLLEVVDLDDTGVSKDASQTQLAIGKQRATTQPMSSVSVDAPTYRTATAPVVVDAPTFRSSTAIVVDAPSQREPPGRAALAAAGPAVARTQTPPRPLDAAAVVAVARAQAPHSSSLDPSAGIAIARTQPPQRSGLAAAGSPSAAYDEIAIPRTRTPMGGGADPSGPAILYDDIAIPVVSLAIALTDDGAGAIISATAGPVARPAASPVGAAPASSALHVAGSNAALTAAPVAAAAIAVPSARGEAEVIDGPAPLAVARPPSTPVLPHPAIAPPRTNAARPPPAALAALQRASAIAARTTTPAARDPVTSPATRPGSSPSAPIPSPPRAAFASPHPSPSAAISSPRATPPSSSASVDEIAVGAQVSTARLAVSARLTDALGLLAAATTTDAACDALMAFAMKRWSAVLLLDVEATSATGRRGHGAQLSNDLAQWLVMTLDEPSLLQAAFLSRSVATVTPPGHRNVEDRLQRLLGMARAPSAIAVVVEGRPACLLAVGDPDDEDLQTAAADLERLAIGAAAAFTRLRGR